MADFASAQADSFAEKAQGTVVEKVQTKVEADTEAIDNASNFSVDYVINYSVPAKERDEAEAAFVQLIEALAKAGFATEVRPGTSKNNLLVFVKISDANLLQNQIYHSRMQDWLYGIRTKAPPSRKAVEGSAGIAKHFADEPITEAERLRLAYLLITKSPKEGGAGISPPSSATLDGNAESQGQWKYVVGIFPLHDHAFNSAWIKKWGTKYMLDAEDLDSIRDKFGERVAFYFAFLQNYFKFLFFPAGFGFFAWLFIGQFSWIYATVNCLWSVVFFEYWKKKEVDLAVSWGTRGVSQIQMPRAEFKYDSEAKDPVTGETVKVYSPFRRLAFQLLQLPFAIACLAAIGGLIAFGFSIEIFINEVYNGPFKQYLAFIPTIILTIAMPIITGILTTIAEKLTVLENYDTEDTHSSMFVQKIFVINFVTSYMPILLTAFVYLPFGKVIVPHLSLFQNIVTRFSPSPAVTDDVKVSEHVAFQINPDRLTKQVIYFTVTAQVVNFLTEVIVPYIKRKVFKAVKDVQEKHSGDKEKDAPEEAEFLERVRIEAGLDVYDVTIDYREMVVQFGYLSLFSAVWPLTAVSFLINNWVEARSDAMKIATGSQRPIPWRADSIGPWLSSLSFLSWLGSVTSAAVVYLFGSGSKGPDGSPWNIKAWALLLTILVAEHLYLLVQLVVRYAIDKMDSPGLQKERAERFALRKQTLDDSLGDSAAGLALQSGISAATGAFGSSTGEASTEGEGTAEDKFWLRQRGADATIQAGRLLIEEADKKDEKSEKTPPPARPSPQEL